MNMFAKFDEIPAMTLQDIKETKCCGLTIKKRYTPHNKVCIKSICLVDMSMFAKLDEIPAMTLQDIKEKKNVTDGERENSIPVTVFVGV